MRLAQMFASDLIPQELVPAKLQRGIPKLAKNRAEIARL